MLRQLWNDESGAIVSAEIVLVATILIIGLIVGLKSLRDAVVAELADVAQAISNLNQTYTYSGVTGHAGGTAGSGYTDGVDFCDTNDDTDKDPANKSKCVVFAVAATGETP